MAILGLAAVHPRTTGAGAAGPVGPRLKGDTEWGRLYPSRPAAPTGRAGSWPAS